MATPFPPNVWNTTMLMLPGVVPLTIAVGLLRHALAAADAIDASGF